VPEAVGLAQQFRELHDRRYDLFHQAFTLGMPMSGKIADGLTEMLLASGLAVPEEEGPVCRYRVTRLADDFIVTDPPEYRGRDRVLYLSDNESLLRARTLPCCDGRQVLDLGSGSGVQAIASYRRGARAVTSIDVSPRAVAVTRFNLALNGLPCEDVRQVPLAEFTPDSDRYDVLVSNPPFVPVPPGTAFMTSGAGGIDGLDFARQLIGRLPELLQPGGIVCLVSLSPGTRHMSELESMLLDHVGERAFSVQATRIFEQPAPIAASLAPFAQRADVALWAKALAACGYTHMHNLLVIVEPTAEPAFHRTVLRPTLDLHPGNKGSTAWDGLHDEIRLALEMAQ
jgi:SAM-dependent methyltransferase